MEKPRFYQSIYNKQEFAVQSILTVANANILDAVKSSSYQGLAFSTPQIMGKLSVIFDRLFAQFLIISAHFQRELIQKMPLPQYPQGPLERFFLGLSRIEDYKAWQSELNDYDFLNRQTPDKVKIKESYYANVRFSIQDAVDQMGQIQSSEFINKLGSLAKEYTNNINLHEVRQSELKNLITTLEGRDLAIARVILDQEISNGNSAEEIAKALQNFVYRDYRKTWTSPSQYYRAEFNGKAVNVPSGSVSYQFRRIARTEINRTYRETYYRQTVNDPLVIGYKWNLSASHDYGTHCECERIAEGDPAHDSPDDPLQGLWEEPAQIPDTHPNCMCFPTAERMSFDQWLDELDEQYLDPTETPEFKEWAKDGGVLMDENGKPKVLYHGTQSLSGYQPVSTPEGFWLTESRDTATSYMVKDQGVEWLSETTPKAKDILDRLPEGVKAIKVYDSGVSTYPTDDPYGYYKHAYYTDYYQVKNGKVVAVYRVGIDLTDDYREIDYVKKLKEFEVAPDFDPQMPHLANYLLQDKDGHVLTKPETRQLTDMILSRKIAEDNPNFIRQFYVKAEKVVAFNEENIGDIDRNQRTAIQFRENPNVLLKFEERDYGYLGGRSPDYSVTNVENLFEIPTQAEKRADYTLPSRATNTVAAYSPTDELVGQFAKEYQEALSYVAQQIKTNSKYPTETVYDITLADLGELASKTVETLYTTSPVVLSSVIGGKEAAIKVGEDYYARTFAATSSEGAELALLDESNPVLYQIEKAEGLVVANADEVTALLVNGTKYQVKSVSTKTTTSDKIGKGGNRKITYKVITLEVAN